MSDPQFQKLRKVIHDRSGLWFADNKKYLLESRLTHRLAELELDDFDQYLMLLTTGPYRQEEFDAMYSRITTNETSFFRNPPQIEIFETRILPELLAARAAQRRLRIWSAGCSTGEEPYTLAILLHRSLGIRLPDWRIEILGTDLSERALESASKGLFTAHALRTTPPLVVGRYFRSDPAGFVLDPQVRAMVTLERLNLKDAAAARRHGLWDVIFCRNVLIYFDDADRERCFDLFHQVLADDGTLLVGHSETVRTPGRFNPYPQPQVFAYAKASSASPARSVRDVA